MYYQITPNYCLALNPKVGCTSFSRAIVEQHYPEIFKAELAKGAVPEKYPWAAYCPNLEKPDRPVLLLVRHPVSRFLSAVVQTGIPAALAITCLLEDITYHFEYRSKPTRLREDVHFKPQYRLLTDNTTLLAFPSQLQTAVELLQLTALPHLNQARGPKPVLTATQVSQVAYFYAKDLELFQRAQAAVN